MYDPTMTTFKKVIRTFTALAGLSIFTGCAHTYYTPEIAGDGAMWSPGAVMFKVPAQAPRFQMRLMARPIQKAPKSAHLPSGTEMVHIRMAIQASPNAPQDAYVTIDPGQQMYVFEDGHQVHPTLIRTSSKDRPKIKVTPKRNQAVDLLYALPPGMGAQDIQHFDFRWAVALSDGGTEQQTTRFDQQSTAPEQNDGFEDSYYYDDDVFVEWIWVD
jgi:hypothetical protein